MGAKRFRIAFSFAGEKREFVKKVALLLAQSFGEEAILYDKFHEAEFSRARLGRYLPKLYNEQSDLVVVVICRDYVGKEWCGLEWDAIFDMLKQRRESEVMLSRFDNATVDGLYDPGFSDLDYKTPEQLAALILKRLAFNEGKSTDYYTKLSPSLGSSGEKDTISQSAPGTFSIYTAGFARRRQLFLDHYARETYGELRFAGRSNEFAQLNEWLQSPNSAILLLTAPAGRGKSALVTRWLPRISPDFKTIFIPVSIRFGTNALHDWTHALYQELSLAISGNVENTNPSVTDDHFIGQLYNLLCRPSLRLKRNIVVVLDGIDESTNREILRELFPPTVGPGVKVLVTARDTLGGRNRSRSEWFEWLSLSDGPSTRWMQLAKLTPDEIAGSLPSEGGAIDNAARTRLSRVLWECCDEGDPLLLGLVLGEQRRERVDAASFTADDVERLTHGYRGVVDRWIDEQVELVSARGERELGHVRGTMTSLLTLLAHARGPILPSELLSLFRIGFGESRTTAPAYLDALDRLVISTADGLVLCHTRIGDYVLSADFGDEVTRATARRSFVAWSAELAARLEASSSNGRSADKISRYQLHWAVEHALSDEATTPERLAPFLGRLWLHARDELDQGTNGFSRDAAAIWRFLRRRELIFDDPAYEGQLAMEFTCALILSSTRRFAGIPPALLKRQVLARRVSEKTLLDLLVGMPAASLAGYLAALRPHLSATALRAVRDALNDAPQEPADHLCLLATAEDQHFQSDFDRAFAFLQTHDFRVSNSKLDFATALCQYAARADSEKFFACALNLAAQGNILETDLIEHVIEAIPVAALRHLEETLYYTLLSHTCWRTAAIWKRALTRMPHEVLASWRERASAFRSGDPKELIALAFMGTWRDREFEAETFALLLEALRACAVKGAAFDLKALHAISTAGIGPFISAHDPSDTTNRWGDLACVAACFLSDDHLDLVQACLDRPMSTWALKASIEVFIARRPEIALTRVEFWRRRELSHHDRAALLATLATSSNPDVIRQCLESLSGLGSWGRIVIDALAANEKFGDIDLLMRMAKQANDAAEVFGELLLSIRHATPTGWEHFARIVRAAANTASDRNLSLTLRSIALSVRSRVLPASEYLSEFMKLAVEAAAQGSFQESIWRFHSLDNELAATVLRSDCIGNPQLRLEIAIHSICQDHEGPDSSARVDVLDALSASASLCATPPWDFLQHVGLIHCAKRLVEFGPESTLGVAMQLVEFIASDRHLCFARPAHFTLNRVADKLKDCSPLRSILGIFKGLDGPLTVDIGIAVCRRIGPALSGELLDLIEQIGRCQGIAWAIRDSIHAIDPLHHRRVLQIAENVGAETCAFSDANSTYTAEILATVWPVADRMLRLEIERRVLYLPPGLALSTGLACVRVPAAREFQSGELEHLHRSLNDVVHESDLSFGMGSAEKAVVNLMGQALAACGEDWPIVSFRRLIDQCALVPRAQAVASVFGVQFPDGLRARLLDRVSDVLKMLP